MKRTRFSIAGLMGLVVIIAIGIAGLKQATPLWASSCYTLACGCLIVGALLSIQARSQKRAFWTGFAITGWAYFALIFLVGATPRVQPPPFLTETLLERAVTWFHPELANVGFTVALTPTFSPPAAIAPPGPTAPMTLAPSIGPNNSITTTLTSSPTPPTQLANLYTSGTWFVAGFSANDLNFRQVGQSLATLCLAYLGGLVSFLIAARRQAREETPSPEVSPSSP